MVFFRITGFECVNRGRRSDRTDKAREEVMICGSVIIGSDIVVSDGETRSCSLISRSPFCQQCCFLATYFLEKIGCQHENFCLWSKALNSTQITDSFL